MKLYKLAALYLLFLTSQSSAQHMFTVLYENAVYLVNEADGRNYQIIVNNNEELISVANSKVRIGDASVFLPGYIEIKDESDVATDYDDQQRKIGGAFYFRYYAKVTSNRDFANAYMVFKWEREDKTSHITVVPLPPLKKDEQQQLSLNFYAPDRFQLVDPEIYYMNVGFEIGTSKTIEKPITPYQYCVDKAGGTLPDGNLKALQMMPIPPIKDAEGNKREGQVDMYIAVDELGYVKSAKVKKATEWVFGKYALMTVPFWLFQPKIVDGKPVPSQVVIPLKF
jgi:hypothetical protein